MKTYRVPVSEKTLNIMSRCRTKLADFYKENHFLYLTIDDQTDSLVLTSVYPTENLFHLDEVYEGPCWFMDLQELESIMVIEEQEKLE